MTDNKMTAAAIKKLMLQLIPAKELTPKSIDEVVKLPAFLEKIRACEQLLETSYDALDFDIQNALVLRRLQQMFNSLLLNILLI